MPYMLKVIQVIAEDRHGKMFYWRVERDGKVVGITEQQFIGFVNRRVPVTSRILKAERPL